MTDKTQPAVSVIMSVYNAEKYVGDAIESILNQSFTDFEFLLLDDGSTDNSLQIISAYKDNRIKVFSQENKGMHISRNTLIKKAQGTFIALLDADDIALPDRLQKQIAYMQQHPDCVAVGMYAEKFGKDTGTIYGFDSKYVNAYADDILYNHKVFIVDPSYLIRKSALQKLDGPYKINTYALDSNLWRRLSYLGKIDNIPQVGIKYRVHESSFSYDKKELLKLSVFLSVVSVYEQYKNNQTDAQITEYDINQQQSLSDIRKRYSIWHSVWGGYVYYCKHHNTLFNRFQVGCIKLNYKINRLIYFRKRKVWNAKITGIQQG